MTSADIVIITDYNLEYLRASARVIFHNVVNSASGRPNLTWEEFVQRDLKD
uniref:Uncharacterized protein n=1 Tax=Arundo donax TaxID=35708 RepID=A0A0A9F1Z5_ARUDO